MDISPPPNIILDCYTTIGEVPDSDSDPPPQKCTLSFERDASNEFQNLVIQNTSDAIAAISYRISGNIVRVKLNDDGALAYIAFRNPGHYLRIDCDHSHHLDSFYSALKFYMNYRLCPIEETNKPEPKPVKNLIIRAPDEYPRHGLPKTLTSLNANGSQLNHFDANILYLEHLTILELGNNAILEVPKQLGQMRLHTLSMPFNMLGSDMADWQWLDGYPIRCSLKHLNLSNNQLHYFPYGLVRLSNLTLLKLEGNYIKKIPFAIRRMQKLRLLHLKDNLLATLPQTIVHNQLNLLDLTNNPLLAAPFRRQTYVHDKPLVGVRSLKQLACKSVIAHQIQYTNQTLPECLANDLDELPLCPCGAICFSFHSNCKSLTLSVRHLICNNKPWNILCETVYCSERCFRLGANRKLHIISEFRDVARVTDDPIPQIEIRPEPWPAFGDEIDDPF